MMLASGFWGSAWLIRRLLRPSGVDGEYAWPGLKGLTLVLAGGLLIGGSQLMDNARTFREPGLKPILERTGRGQAIPAGHPQRRIFLKNGWALAKIVVGGVLILATGWFEYSMLWFLTLSAYLLTNSALLTGLEFENFHWFQFHAMIGEIMILALGGRWIDRRFGWRPAFFALPIALCLFAAVWRPYEILHATKTIENSAILRELAPLRPALETIGPNNVLAGTIPETNVALLFTQGGQLYQEPYLAHNSLVPDQDVHERYALNAWLLGVDRASYVRSSSDVDFTEIPQMTTRSEWSDAEVTKRRIAVFDALLAGRSETLLKRHHPDYLLQPASSSPPERGGTWTKVATSGKWTLWKLQDRRTGG